MKLNSKKIYSLLATCFFIIACQTSKVSVVRDVAQESSPVQDVSAKKEKQKVTKEAKTYLKNLSVAERTQALRQARVSVKNYDPAKVASFDIISDLEKRCGPMYTYQKVSGRTAGGFFGQGKRNFEGYAWPKLQCLYRQDHGKLGGGTAKFYCDFKDPADAGEEADIKTKKVKYVSDLSEPFKSEVLETVLATTVTRLLGFYAETYCPADITCVNCPSAHPWRKVRSSGKPSAENYQFPVAIVEKLLKGYTMSNKEIHPYVQGIEWTELAEIENITSPENRSLLIEREAWMLWLNFIQHTDAGSYNQRLSCLDVQMSADGKPVCKDSIMFTHDYGHAFYKHFNFEGWAARPPTKPNSKGQACIGNMTMEDLGLNPKSHFSGVIFSPAISQEARDLLVSRLEAVTDHQWTTAYQLARLEELSDTTTQQFLNVVKSKIALLKAADCLPFDSGTSILYPKK